MNWVKEYLGELVGTFILVFIGCGSVAIAVLYFPLSLGNIALIWGVGVALAIYTVRRYCPAHLNPAVSIAMVLTKKLPLSKLAFYSLAQIVGAWLAGFLLLNIIHSDLSHFETVNHLIRGEYGSYHSAVMFGEFYPNPSFETQLSVSHFQACVAEALGTCVLVLVILILTRIPRGIDNIIPALIGLTVAIIIMIVAPFTQAGLNPARDLGPRIVAFFGGWEYAALPQYNWGFMTVYVVSPILGGALAYKIYQRLY